MPTANKPDTIRILVSTDNHVGYNERDPIRGDDSWKSFDEVMCLAKSHDVDMVLLAGDLFHENKPSRKSMYQVMRSLRTNCYGDKPCELEMLSDGSEQFAGAFNHVNYEDQNINVAIPVFSIHGNHDDPSGEGHLAALDILQMSGLVNYYGRTPESDNIHIRPVLLQKGATKLALYGMSNVRDERLFRTFRDGNVKFFRPVTQRDDWFNLMSVHQNHHAYTDTGYLPETFLPSYMDLVIWGHEHECLIQPRTNPETGFKVMQPGSSVATSLVPGEAEPKHVAIVSITGREFRVEPIRLKSVRPFVMKEIVLKDFPEMRAVAEKPENRTRVNQFLTTMVEELIEEANQSWLEAQQESGISGSSVTDEELTTPPLPLIRLRIDHSAPEGGGSFEIENPQRFSNRFLGKVANVSDVVAYHRKRTVARQSKVQPDMPDDRVMAALSIDSIKVEKLVKEFLTVQSLTILPQNSFNDAVGRYVDKGDKQAMQNFVTDSLKSQVDSLLAIGEGDEEEYEDRDNRIADAIEKNRVRLEQSYARGEMIRTRGKRSRRPRPDDWDSDAQGHWEDSMQSLLGPDQQTGRNDDDLGEGEDDGGDSENGRAANGKTRNAKSNSNLTATKGKPAAAAAAKSSSAQASSSRPRRRQPFEEDDEESNDVVMLDNDDENNNDEGSGLFVSQSPSMTPAPRNSTRQTKSPAKKPTAQTSKAMKSAPAKSAPAARSRQSQLSFTVSPNSSAKSNGKGKAKAAPARRVQEPSEDEISDDDAFEPPPATQRSRR